MQFLYQQWRASPAQEEVVEIQSIILWRDSFTIEEGGRFDFSSKGRNCKMQFEKAVKTIVHEKWIEIIQDLEHDAELQNAIEA